MWYLPGLYFVGLIDAERRFLNCLQLSDIPFKIQVVGNIIHGLLCYLFIVELQLGIRGAGIATSIANALIFLGMLTYSITNQDIKTAIFFPNKRSFMGLKTYMSLALPAAFMLCFDFWAFDLITVISGLIDKESQAAQVFLANMNDALFCLAIGISNAACSLIGMNIGSNNLADAKLYEKATLSVSFFMIAILLAPFFIFKSSIIACLTSVEPV